MEPTFIRENILKVKKGDQKAFEPIVSIYQNRIYYHCYRMTGESHDAEDLAKEAFVKAFVNIRASDDRRTFSRCVDRIATNLTIDRLRKRKPDYHLDQAVKGTEDLTMFSPLETDEDLP